MTLPVAILCECGTLDALWGVHLPSFYGHVLPCLRWATVECITERSVTSCLCSKGKWVNCVDLVLVIVVQVKSSREMYLSQLSQMWSVLSLSSTNLSGCGHGISPEGNMLSVPCLVQAAHYAGRFMLSETCFIRFSQSRAV